MSKINGVSVGVLASGIIFVYAGITGKSIPGAIQAVIQGKSPATATISNPIAPSSSSSGNVSDAGGNPSSSGTSKNSPQANQALGRSLASAYGWGSGDEWTALNNIVMAESGWQDEIVNSSSGAAGIAQNIQGWSSGYQEGNARQQIMWMLNYIKQRYGDPVAAWNFHVANGYY